MKRSEENDKNVTKDLLRIYQSSHQMMKSKNYHSAISNIENIVKTKESSIENPLKLNIFLLLGLSYYQLSKFSESKEYLIKSNEIVREYMNEYNTERGGFLK